MRLARSRPQDASQTLNVFPDAPGPRKNDPHCGGGHVHAFIEDPVGHKDGICAVSEFFQKLLPLGGFAISLFVSCRIGWGCENIRAEASEGACVALPRWTVVLFRYLVPAMIIFVMIAGQG